jgi:hypothetical protein
MCVCNHTHKPHPLAGLLLPWGGIWRWQPAACWCGLHYTAPAPATLKWWVGEFMPATQGALQACVWWCREAPRRGSWDTALHQWCDRSCQGGCWGLNTPVSSSSASCCSCTQPHCVACLLTLLCLCGASCACVVHAGWRGRLDLCLTVCDLFDRQELRGCGAAAELGCFALTQLQQRQSSTHYTAGPARL